MKGVKIMRKPIRVAHIIGKWVGGGVEEVVMNYYRNINRDKIQFDFICDSDSIEIPYEEIESLGGRVILIPPYQKILSYHKKLKKILKENKYKIVHSHINTLSIFPLFAAKCAKIPIRIAHNHSTTNKKEWIKNSLKLILKPMSKIFATDYFACTSHAGKWLFGKSEFYILNNAINLNKFKYDSDIRKKKRKEFGIDDDTVVIGHIGRFVEQKNHRYVVKIFNEYHKKHKNSILLLVGQGPLVAEIKNIVLKLKLSDCVKFLGQRKDVNELYQVFDKLVFPSLYEGLGMVLVEAQATGLPCIASTEVPKDAEVTDLINFIDIDESSINKWTDCLNKDIKSIRESQTSKLTSCNYNIEKEAKKLEKYYINILKE